MTVESVATTVEVLGKPYQIKCPEKDISSLQEAARYLEDKMRAIREAAPGLTPDRLAIITALNIAHQFLMSEHVKQMDSSVVNDRLRDLQNKLETALVKHAQLELSSAR